MTSELPPTWLWTTLDDACESVSKAGPSLTQPTFRYIDLGAVDNNSKTIARVSELDVNAAPSRAKQVVRRGDVVFSNVRVYLENIAAVPDELDGEVASTAFCVLRPREGVIPRYLYHYVTSGQFIRKVNELQRGNSPPSVQDADVKAQQFPLAPTAEQNRIASKIDELFSRIDEGEHALEQVQTLVERYRQSILKAAVTGELTREWREKNKSKLESGEALLGEILQARREAWEKAELGKMKAKGITPSDGKWKQKYEEPSAAASSGLPDLPQGWIWATAEAVCESVHSGTTPERQLLQATDSTGVPFIKVHNLTFDGTLDFSADSAYVDARHHATSMGRSRTLPGDVLTNIVGPPLGKVSVVPSTHDEWNINQAVVGFRPLGALRNDFLSIYLQSDPAKAWLLATTKTTTSQVNLAVTTCRRLPIPLPTQQEQKLIREVVEKAFSYAAALLGAANDASKRSTALRQSTLGAAFSGQLIPQRATDESASSLLERIAAEREATDASQAVGRRKKSSA